MFKIIIVEDDKDIREELQVLLNNSGYEVEIILDFNNAVEQIQKSNAHLLLLDVELPDTNGFEICKKVRLISKIPIIFVTSKNGAMDELKGIMMGGDDYVQKPYNIPVLLARISSLLKRSYSDENSSSVLEYKNIKLDMLSGMVTYNEKQIELSRNEFKILCYLFKNAGKIISRIDIVEYMWDNQMYIDDNTLSVNMTRIREKLSDIGIASLIETKRGQGYKI